MDGDPRGPDVAPTRTKVDNDDFVYEYKENNGNSLVMSVRTTVATIFCTIVNNILKF